MPHLGEAENPLVPFDPLVEASLFDVPDHVVDRAQPSGSAEAEGGKSLRGEAGTEDAAVTGTVDECVLGLAVGGDRRGADDA